MYSLLAVIVHIGKSPKGGHYVSYISTKDGWYQFDDATVSTV